MLFLPHYRKYRQITEPLYYIVVMLHTKLHYKEMAKTAKTYSSLGTKMTVDIHKSFNELLR